MVSSILYPAVYILGSQNEHGRAEGIADPGPSISSVPPPRGLPPGSVALPAGFRALPALSEALPAHSEAIPAGSKKCYSCCR